MKSAHSVKHWQALRDFFRHSQNRERKTVYALTFGDFVLPKGVNICSVNLDRETTFLTLVINRTN